MRTNTRILLAISISFLVGACTTAYKAKPLPLKAPNSYANAVDVAGCTVAAEAFTDRQKAEDAFGFDVLGAGMLPVEVVFDNSGPHTFKINAGQTFLEDEKGNLWPILDQKTAYDRATRYSQTNEIFKQGAYTGFLGAAAGAVIGAAIGIVSGEGVGEALGKGAAVGAAAGATIGGVQGAGESGEARRTIINDLNGKSLQNKDISGGLSYGFLFFPAEAQSARQLRLQLAETGGARDFVLKLALGPVNRSSVVEVYAGKSGNAAAPQAPPAVVAPPAAGAAPLPPADAGIDTAPPAAGGQTKCREWKMVERRMVSRYDSATGKTVQVPQEKWDWVEVPCGKPETGSAGPAGAETDPPPEYVFAEPPTVAVIPGTYVYTVPDVDVDILFYHGYWYRPFRGIWYWSSSYNGPWVYLAIASVPHVLITLPSGYHRLAHGYYRIPYARLHANWHRWETTRYWHRDRRWREYDHRGGRH